MECQAGAAVGLIYEGELLNIAKLFYDFFYSSHLHFQRFLSWFARVTINGDCLIHGWTTESHITSHLK